MTAGFALPGLPSSAMSSCLFDATLTGKKATFSIGFE